MKKISYEILMNEADKLYKKLDYVSSSLCKLKDSVILISEFLEKEYDKKYNKEKTGQ